MCRSNIIRLELTGSSKDTKCTFMKPLKDRQAVLAYICSRIGWCFWGHWPPKQCWSIHRRTFHSRHVFLQLCCFRLSNAILFVLFCTRPVRYFIQRISRTSLPTRKGSCLTLFERQQYSPFVRFPPMKKLLASGLRSGNNGKKGAGKSRGGTRSIQRSSVKWSFGQRRNLLHRTYGYRYMGHLEKICHGNHIGTELAHCKRRWVRVAKVPQWNWFRIWIHQLVGTFKDAQNRFIVSVAEEQLCDSK